MASMLSIKTQFVSLRLYPSVRQVSINGRMRKLSPKVFDLLLLLVTRPEQSLSAEQISEALYPGRPIHRSRIGVLVYRARRELGNLRAIESKFDLGYQIRA